VASLDLEAHFDESGTAGKTMLVGSYLSTAEKWRAFIKVWTPPITDLGLPHFHMEPCISGTKEFEKISIDDVASACSGRHGALSIH
jgi:hypothetical protein